MANVKIEVRKPLRFLPAVGWALALDATDLAVGWIPFAGEVLDIAQAAAAMAIFEDSRMVYGLFDIAFPVGLDLFPSYTTTYFLLKSGKL
jgi:hypothetical protein